MDIKQTFNNEASEYEFTSRAVNIYFDEALETLVSHIACKKQTIKVLDICCGTGILTEKVAKKFPKAQFTGVDFSSGMLDIAKERMKDYHFECVVCDICDSEKMNNLGQYDLVISSFGIHNVHGYEQKHIALKNILSHLKSGGQYITCDLLKGEDKKQIKHFYNFQKQWLLKTYSKKQTREWLRLLDEEDNPETLQDNLQLLTSNGLQNVKLVWNREFLGIWQGTK